MGKPKVVIVQLIVYYFPVYAIIEQNSLRLSTMRTRVSHIFTLVATNTQRRMYMIGYKRKNVTFKEGDTNDMKLHNELKKVPHGEFSKITKELWKKRLKEGKE